MRIIKLSLILLVALAGCKTGIDPNASSPKGLSTMSITMSGFECSGATDDPCKIPKGNVVDFSAVDSDGNPIEVSWSTGSADASISKAISTTTCGTFSSNTYTPPSSISGDGLCVITGTAVEDPTVSSSIYVRIIVGDAVTYTNMAAYSPQTDYTVSDGAIAVFKGRVNTVFTQNQLLAATNMGSGVLLSTYSTDISSSLISFPAAVPILTDVHGLPIPMKEGEGEESLAIGPDGICYEIESTNETAPVLFVSEDSDCLRWNGPYVTARSYDEITGDSLPLREPSLVVDSAGVVYVAWNNVISSRTGNDDIYINKCSASGGSYICGAEVCITCGLDGDLGLVGSSAITVWGSGDTARINVFWSHGPELLVGDGRKVYTAVSFDGGGSFTAPVQVSPNVPNVWGVNPNAALDSNGNIYALFSSNYIGGRGTYVAKSVDGGVTFGDSFPASGADTSSPAFWIDGSNFIHVVSQNGYENTAPIQIFYEKSTAAADNTAFSQPAGFPTNLFAFAEGPQDLSITGNGSNVYVVYMNQNTHAIDMVVSTDGGETWGDPIEVVPAVDGLVYAILPSAAHATASGVHIAWSQGITLNPNQDTYISFCTTTSCNTATAVGATSKMAPDMFPMGQDSSGNDKYGILWSDGRSGNFDIYYMSGTFGTNPTDSGTAIDSLTLQDIYPSGAVGPDGSLHVVWLATSDATLETPGDLYYSKSTDSGVTWSSPIMISSGGADVDTFKPAINVGDDGVAHVAWGYIHEAEDKFLTMDVYYREYKDGSWSAIENLTPDSSTTLDGAPSISIGQDNTVYVSYSSVSFVGNVVTSEAIKMRNKGETDTTWSDPVKVADGYVKDRGEDNSGILSLYVNSAIDHEGRVIDSEGNLVTEDRITVAWVKGADSTNGDLAVDVPDNGIYVARSVDNGATWSTPEEIVPSSALAGASTVKILQMQADVNGRIYILYSYGNATEGAIPSSNVYLAVGE